MNEEILNTLDALKQGMTILYPSDTIWGIGCDATNADAVDKIYHIKKREPGKSMIILIENINQVFSYVNNPPDVALDMMELSTKPLTIIFDGAKNLPVNLIADDGSIAIRLVNDNFCKTLLKKFRKPIVSTSANFSGSKTPKAYSDIDNSLIQLVDYTVKEKQNMKLTKPSSIIRIRANNQIEIIRK
jgi:L-threonylcarbamoyladenylate synthase